MKIDQPGNSGNGDRESRLRRYGAITVLVAIRGALPKASDSDSSGRWISCKQSAPDNAPEIAIFRIIAMTQPTQRPGPNEANSNEISIRIGSEIRNIGIPPRPEILAKVQEEMAKDEPDIQRLADIIGSDVGLAASLIKVANSPYFGTGRKVRSVPEALLVVGLKVAAQTIAGIALERTFPHVPSLERFWDSAACTARVSGWLARELGRRTQVRPDDAYTFGLFHDCGIPVLMIPFPEYRDILVQANKDAERSFTDIEDEQLSINHAHVGAELAEDWRLPEETCAAIRHHHKLAAIDESSDANIDLKARQLIAVAAMAQHLIHRNTGKSHSQEWTKLGDACLTLLGVDDSELEELACAARPVVSSAE
jgi:HD-like signal output (HDOD) protein